MATSAPKTQDWKAWQDLMPGPGKPKLIVTGSVQVSNTNQTPHLNEPSSPGFNPEILLLDLTITTSGSGNEVMTWRNVRFEKDIEKNQYSEVDILWNGQILERIKVETVQ